MNSKKKNDFTTLILTLLNQSETINLNDVAKAAELSEKAPAARRAIQRAFAKLIKEELIQAQGNARARVYVLKDNFKKNAAPADVNQKDYVLSLLGIYEFNDISLMRDLYVWAYKRSANRYTAIQQSIGEPNQFKLKYRNVIHDIVRNIILENTPPAQIVSKIKQMISEFNLSESDAMQLFQIIEVEIMSLHEGNIARFKIKPSEFLKWKNGGE